MEPIHSVNIVALRWYASSTKKDMETVSEAVLPMIVVMVCRLLSSDDDDDDDDASSDFVDNMMDDVVDLDNDSCGSSALLVVAFLVFQSPAPWRRGGGEVAAAWR